MTSNNGESEGDPVVGSRSEREEEVLLFRSFQMLARKKLVNNDRVRRWLYDTSSDYAAEKKIVSEMSGNGTGKALLFGLGTFVFLRRGPWLMERLLFRRPPTAGHKLDHSTANVSPFHNNSNSNERPTFLFKVTKLTLDLLLSTMVAAYSSPLFMDQEKFMSDLTSLPLVEGKSLISHELCSDVIHEYQRLLPQSALLQNQQRRDASHKVRAISEFVDNCIRRNEYEKQLAPPGTEDAGSVFIPSPGVPRELDISFLSSKDQTQDEFSNERGTAEFGTYGGVESEELVDFGTTENDITRNRNWGGRP